MRRVQKSSQRCSNGDKRRWQRCHDVGSDGDRPFKGNKASVMIEVFGFGRIAQSYPHRSVIGCWHLLRDSENF